MKLYATVASERATKGQGGNKYLDIVVTNENSEIICLLSMYPDNTCRMTHRNDIEIDINETNFIGKQELAVQKNGEKKKGERGFMDICNGDDISCALHMRH